MYHRWNKCEEDSGVKNDVGRGLEIKDRKTVYVINSWQRWSGSLKIVEVSENDIIPTFKKYFSFK